MDLSFLYESVDKDVYLPDNQLPSGHSGGFTYPIFVLYTIYCYTDVTVVYVDLMKPSFCASPSLSDDSVEGSSHSGESNEDVSPFLDLSYWKR